MLALSVAESPAYVQRPLNPEGGQNIHEALKLMTVHTTPRAMVTRLCLHSRDEVLLSSIGTDSKRLQP